jgi:hypothetical protein
MPVDEVADLFLDAAGEAAAAGGMKCDVMDGMSGLGPIGRLRPAVARLEAALAESFNPVAQVRTRGTGGQSRGGRGVRGLGGVEGNRAD